MSYTEKIDVLDMIISILREHEEKLDKLAYRLEAVAEALEERNPEFDRYDRVIAGLRRMRERRYDKLRMMGRLLNEDGRDL